MLIKLIFKNVRKNMKDYSIYFLTIMISISLFYSFNAIESQKALTQMSVTRSMLAENMNKYITVLSVVIAIVLSFLILYSNQFLLKRRKKELGVYMLLGMNKNKVSFVLVGETILIGACGLIVGLAVGFLLSQFLSLMALRLFAVNLNEFKIAFSTLAFIKTVICFVIIYFMVNIMNLKTISSLELIDLLVAGRKNEEYVKRKNIFYVFLLVLAVAAIALCGYLLSKDGDLPKLSNIKWITILLVVGSMILFYSISIVFISCTKLRDSIYFKKLNAFLIQQLGSKVQSNFLSITVVCLLLTVTICIVSTGISVALTMDNKSKLAAPYDMSIITTNSKTGDMDLYKYAMEQGIPLDKYLDKSVQISQRKSDLVYKDLFLDQKVELWKIDSEVPNLAIPIISLSDYNSNLKLQGKEAITLADDEFLINCNYKGTVGIVERFLKERDSLTINGTKLKLKSKKCLENVIVLTGVDNNDRGTIIVSDKVANTIDKEYNILCGTYRGTTDPDRVVKDLSKLTVDLNAGFRYNTKTMILDFYYGSTALISFLCCYIGFVFLLICVALLALQQLLETTDNVYRYGLLRKLGADEKLINRTLFKQIAIYFIVPLIVAIVYSLKGLKQIMNITESFINMNIDVNMLFTILLFLLVYGGYFIATYFSCKRIISEKK